LQKFVAKKKNGHPPKLTEEPEVVREIIADERRFERKKKQFKKRLKARQELRMMKELAEQRNNYVRSLKRNRFGEEKCEEDSSLAARRR